MVSEKGEFLFIVTNDSKRARDIITYTRGTAFRKKKNEIEIILCLLTLNIKFKSIQCICFYISVILNDK